MWRPADLGPINYQQDFWFTIGPILSFSRDIYYVMILHYIDSDSAVMYSVMILDSSVCCPQCGSHKIEKGYCSRCGKTWMYEKPWCNAVVDEIQRKLKERRANKKRWWFLDKYGYPVETFKNRPVVNFIRRLLHTRKITRKTPYCMLPQKPVEGCDSTSEGEYQDSIIRMDSLEDVKSITFRECDNFGCDKPEYPCPECQEEQDKRGNFSDVLFTITREEVYGFLDALWESEYQHSEEEILDYLYEEFSIIGYSKCRAIFSEWLEQRYQRRVG